MPRAYECGTWDGAPNFRWKKMYRGKVYSVTCKELGCMVFTKEGSAKAANDWWRKKRAEIDGMDWPGRVQTAFDSVTPEERTKAMVVADSARLLGLLREMAARDTGLAGKLAELEREHGLISQFAREAKGEYPLGSVTPNNRTIGYQVGLWLERNQADAKQGVKTVQAVQCITYEIAHFVSFAGKDTAVESINAGMLSSWYAHCAGRVSQRDESPKDGWSVDYARKVHQTSAMFIKWLWDEEVIDSLPRNFKSKAFRFSRPAKAITTYTNEEISLLLNAASGQYRLHLLLMLNTGCTQVDISDLELDQIDLAAGTITRRRSKTGKKANTPEVCYKLWPVTLDLLGKYMQTSGKYALLTRDGTQWVRGGVGEARCDSISSAFNRLRKKVGIKKALKLFRKTSATRLKSDPTYRDLRGHFLGHAPSSIADRHYAAESQALLDSAVLWLGKQYGLA